MNTDNSNNHKTPKQNFFRKRWWGIACLTISILISFYTCSPQTLPSSKFGGPVYYAKTQKDHTIQIEQETSSFKILLYPSGSLRYPIDQEMNNDEIPFSVTNKDGVFYITGLSPYLSEEEMNSIWEGDAVTVSRSDKGIVAVKSGYDYSGVVLNAVYSIQDNKIFGHHFEIVKIYLAIIGLFWCFVIYISGAIIRGIVNFLKNRAAHETTPS